MFHFFQVPNNCCMFNRMSSMKQNVTKKLFYFFALKNWRFFGRFSAMFYFIEDVLVNSHQWYWPWKIVNVNWLLVMCHLKCSFNILYFIWLPRYNKSKRRERPFWFITHLTCLSKSSFKTPMGQFPAKSPIICVN